MRYCKEKDIKAHPARFPAALPEYFIRMLTDPDEVVLDPFGGSCITGEVAERLGRKWICAELVENYLEGARGRFERPSSPPMPARQSKKNDDGYYRVPHPGLLWNGGDERESAPIPEDGSQLRPAKTKGSRCSLSCALEANHAMPHAVTVPHSFERGGSTI